LSGTIPLALGGDCSRAFDYELHTTMRLIPETGQYRMQSAHTDGPRSLQHPLLPAHLRRTAASLHFRGNPRMVPTDNAVPVDIADLSSHDLCAVAAGPATVEAAPGSGDKAVTLEQGTMFRSPSYRATFDALVYGTSASRERQG